MKSSTKYLIALGTAAFVCSAMANVPFNESQFEGLPQIHRTVPVAADFNGNGYLDLYHGGQLDPDLDKPGIWSWSQTSTMIYNLGNDIFEVDKWEAVPNDEPNKDDEGNPILDEDGNPVYSYHMQMPKHGMRVSSEDNTAALDFNNDGLVDILKMGWNNSDDWTGMGDEWKTSHLSLYKNNGDGTFSLVTEAEFPVMRPDNSGTPNAIAIGDYDRDGYVDVLVSGVDIQRGEGEELMPGRAVRLYRNLGGTGKFENMLIAKVKGGVWTNEAKSDEEKDEDGNVIVPSEVITPRQELEGWFAPASGLVMFADLNNDGWLDIVNVGWMDSCHIGDRQGGTRSFIYINNEGKEFVDVTPGKETFVATNDGGAAMVDFDGDGYLDFFLCGYNWDGYQWCAFTFYNNQEEDIYGEPEIGENVGLEGTQGMRPQVRDFDGDGNYDIFYNGSSDDLRIFYGDNYGNYTKVDYNNDSEFGRVEVQGKFACVADLNNDGHSDIFHTGYNGKDRVYYNGNNDAPEAPAAPENVKVEYADGQLNVSWEYDEDTAISEGLAFNVYIKNLKGEIYSLLPADIETGFVRVADGKHVALRPNINSYSIKTDDTEAEVGVQAISLKNETYSAFAKTATAGVKEISATKAIKNLKVTVSGNEIVVAGNGEAVTIFNALGQKVATGVAGEAIAVEGNGIYVVATANGSAKIVK